LKENGDLLLSMLLMTDEIPTVAELMDSPLAKYITLAANDCGYSGMAEGAIPNEGAQGPIFAVDGEGHRRSTQRRDPIERLVPGADFAGMYGHEKPTDPVCAKSCSEFVIVFTGVPVLWQSKLQTQTALFTMEAEVIALAACMRKLILIMDMVQLLAVAVGIPAGDVNIRVSVHEDNSGALVLAETLPPQFMPHSKYYTNKTIWFCEEINKRGIKLLKIETSEQFGICSPRVLLKPHLNTFNPKSLVGKHISLVLILYLSSV
jgi:hypothetical protein